MPQPNEQPEPDPIAPDKHFKALTAAEIQCEQGSRTVVARISTVDVDREHEVMVPKGIRLEGYQKNPVVLWAHDYHEPPIGRNQWIKADKRGLVAKTEFADTERGREVFSLYQGGFLKAFSIGFLPGKSHVPEPDEIRKTPEWAEAQRIWDDVELLEYSAVPIPSNRDALAMAVAKGLTLSVDMRRFLDINGGAEDVEVPVEPQTQSFAEPTVTVIETAPPATVTVIEVKQAPTRIILDWDSYMRERAARELRRLKSGL